jgi:sodium transport system permease protein
VAVGFVIGYIAVQTGSLVPCMLFHLTYNAFMLTSLKLPELTERWPEWAVPFRRFAHGEIVYHWWVVAACGVASAALLWWFQRLPYQATKEEQLSDARARQPHHPLAPGVSANAE